VAGHRGKEPGAHLGSGYRHGPPGPTAAPAWVSRLVASIDEARLISVEHGGTVPVWHTAAGAVPAEVDTGARHGLTGQPAIDPHHVRWATADGDRVLLWETS
jgi:hypothetical protein